MSANIPRYELLADHFFEPEMVGKGSVIEYDGVPNNTMRPLNPEAEAKLAAWYEEVFPLLDEKSGKPVLDHQGKPQTHQPRLELKPIELRNPGKPVGIRVVSTPAPADVQAGATLAALANAPAKEWERPAPEAPNPTGVNVVAAKPPLEGNTTKVSA